MTTPAHEPITGEQLGTCRSCRASVRWAVMRESGKRMPLDLAPRPEGNVVFPWGFDQPAITTQQGAKAGIPVEGLNTFQSHYATCPQGDRWRKKK